MPKESKTAYKNPHVNSALEFVALELVPAFVGIVAVGMLLFLPFWFHFTGHPVRAYGMVFIDVLFAVWLYASIGDY